MNARWQSQNWGGRNSLEKRHLMEKCVYQSGDIQTLTNLQIIGGDYETTDKALSGEMLG